MDNFLSEIRIWGCNFAPRYWAFCNGATLPLNQNTALFALIGTIYGGDGKTTLGLPDLRGRTPVCMSPGIPLGTKAGEESHVLTQNEMPMHNHSVVAADTTDGATNAPAGRILSQAPGTLYHTAADGTLAATSIGTAGGSNAHENRQPSLALNFCIATQGIFPSRN